MQTWWPQILAFIRTGITNAGSEGTNRVIKTVARDAYGFRNPVNQRLGTPTPPPDAPEDTSTPANFAEPQWGRYGLQFGPRYLIEEGRSYVLGPHHDFTSGDNYYERQAGLEDGCYGPKRGGRC